jgi:hypothetical protein
MKRRLLVILAFLALIWVVGRQLKKRISAPATDWAPGEGTAGGASIDQLVRSEPLQPSSPPAAAETAAPSEEEGVTPPHGDPLEQELAEATEAQDPAEPTEAAAEERIDAPAQPVEAAKKPVDPPAADQRTARRPRGQSRQGG